MTAHPFNRRQFVKTTSTLGVAAFAAGCVSGDESSPDDDGDSTGDDTDSSEPGASDSRGGYFVRSTPDEADTLDPRMNSLLWYGNAAHYLFDALLMQHPDGTGPVPHVATGMPEEIDETTYVVEIEEGVQFHNGDEMTAGDVAYSFNWVLDPDNASPNLANIEFIDEVEASDTYEVTFHLDYPFALFEDALASMNAAIVPESVAEELGEEEFGRNPVGSGPFQLDDFEPASHLQLSRFDDYFLGPAILDGLEYRIIPEQEVAYVDLATDEMHQTTVPETLVGEAESDSSIVTEQYTNFNYRGLILNCFEEPFDDVRVREAMQYLVDYDDLVQGAVGPLGNRIYGFMPEELGEAWEFPLDEWESEYLPDQDHDRAVELLDQAGVGTDFEVDILSLSGESWMGLSTILQNEFEQIGVDASVREVGIGEWLDGLGDGTFDVCTYGWGGGDDPDGYFYYMFRDIANDDGGIPEDDLGNASAGYIHEAYRNDSEVSSLLGDADDHIRNARSVLDPDERRDHYVEAAEIVQGLYPVIPVYSSESVVGWRDSVQDFDPTPFGDQQLFNHWNEVWIDE